MPLHTMLGRILLVIAHPDDESMFFLPTLLALRRAHLALYLLCLSTGNAYGKGKVRSNELRSVCRWLGVRLGSRRYVDAAATISSQIPDDHVRIVDDLQLQVSRMLLLLATTDHLNRSGWHVHGVAHPPRHRPGPQHRPRGAH